MNDARLAGRVIEPEEEAKRISRLLGVADEHTPTTFWSAKASTPVSGSRAQLRMRMRLHLRHVWIRDTNRSPSRRMR